MEFHDWAIIVVVCILVLYANFIYNALKGWLRKMPFDETQSEHQQKYSIVVAARNEERNITSLVQSIYTSTTDQSLWELIIVNDHSTDKTLDVCNSLKDEYENIKVVSLEPNKTGKKEAVLKGISLAQYDIILQTDADCVVTPYWANLLVQPFENPSVQMTLGAVQFSGNNNNFLQKVFSLEFISLVASGAGYSRIGKHIFANAANMAYRRQSEKSLEHLDQRTPSGDDVFRLHFHKQKGNEIVFVKNENAIVKTNAPQSIKEFVSQRIRWSSKAKYYTDKDTQLVTYIVGLLNLLILSLGISSIFVYDLIYPFLMCFGGKLLLDIVFFRYTLPFFHSKHLLSYVIPVSIFYPIYVSFIGIYSIFAKYNWKGRSF